MTLLTVFAWLGYISLFSSPAGVTDFKAVKDSSTSDSPPPSINLLVITASAGGFFVFCILALCIIFTYRRKVGADIMEHWDNFHTKSYLEKKFLLSLNFIKWKLP